MKQILKLILFFSFLSVPISIFAAAVEDPVVRCTNSEAARLFQGAPKRFQNRCLAYSLFLQEKIFRSIEGYIKHVEGANNATDERNAMFVAVQQQPFRREVVDSRITLFSCFPDMKDLADTPEEVAGVISLDGSELNAIEQWFRNPKSAGQETLDALECSTNAFLRKVKELIVVSGKIQSESECFHYFHSCIKFCFFAFFKSMGAHGIVPLDNAPLSGVWSVRSKCIDIFGKNFFFEATILSAIEKLKIELRDYQEKREGLNELYQKLLKDINRKNAYRLSPKKKDWSFDEVETEEKIAEFILGFGQTFPLFLDDVTIDIDPRMHVSATSSDGAAMAATEEISSPRRRRGRKRRGRGHVSRVARTVSSEAVEPSSPESSESVESVLDAPAAEESQSPVERIIARFRERGQDPYIRISDEANRAEIVLYNVNRARPERFVYTEHQRVGQWFENPEEAWQNFANKKRIRGESVSERIDPWSKVIHTFTRLVDGQIFNLGIETSWESESRPGQTDKRISIPGEITIAGGRRHFGVFTFTFYEGRENWICYHRCFTTRERSVFLNEMINLGHCVVDDYYHLEPDSDSDLEVGPAEVVLTEAEGSPAVAAAAQVVSAEA